MIMMQHNVVSGVLYISDMLRTKSTQRSPMEEGEPTMNHKPPYQEASGIVVPKSVISYSYSPSRYFQSLFSIVALISIKKVSWAVQACEASVACTLSHRWHSAVSARFRIYVSTYVSTYVSIYVSPTSTVIISAQWKDNNPATFPTSSTKLPTTAALPKVGALHFIPP